MAVLTPRKDARDGTEVFAWDFRRELGGGAAITGCGLAKLGSNCAVPGVVGDDEGDWYRRQLASAGPDIDEIRVQAGAGSALGASPAEADDVVEVPCAVDCNGVLPRHVGRLPDSVRGLVQAVKAYERTTIRAALEGSASVARRINGRARGQRSGVPRLSAGKMNKA